MGRELKRVPLDFDWPLKMRWKGYVNPYRGQKCEPCDGTGSNPGIRELSELWYDSEGFGVRWMYRYGTGRDGKPAERPPWLIDGDCRAWQHDLTQDEVDVLAAAGRLHDFTRVPRTDEQRAVVEAKIADGGNCWTPEPNGYRPTAAEVNEWSHHGMGHDAINRWICVKARAKRLGISADPCRYCEGHGVLWPSPEFAQLHEDWERSDPPSGDGYQLWETTSEGAPVSPVFPTLDALCEWVADNATTFGSNRASAAEWKRMLDGGLVVHREGDRVFL